ncbi:MAG: uroporphyrinogen-III C-methyltransferase [Ruminococcus sp.]|nr:uroporphyrinogen-III C-methyltransferase [Ruminococcus sp.]
MKGKVYLVGAGCGSYDMITLRGMKILGQADAVLYDALIDYRLLDFVPEYAEKIPVGKRCGNHSENQENINNILIEKAKQYKKVVRLKGGDSLVFGRGGEEALALENAEIPYEIIPGISSCIAAPEMAGIPVTHRGISGGFHVITAHSADYWRSLEIYARLKETLVILMGVNNLDNIMKDLANAFMPIDTPAAVISNGGTPFQKTVRGCIFNIAELAEKEKISAPAVIVVGKTAKFNFTSDYESRPLSGVSVSVTGTNRFYGRISALLGKNGADVRHCCKMETVVKEFTLPDFSEYKWIVFTSANGVEIFFDKMRAEKRDVRSIPEKAAVIGEGTGAALERHGIYPFAMPEKFTSRELGKIISENALPDERVIIFRAEQGSSDLTDVLNAAGIACDDIKIYDLRSSGEPYKIETDYLIFASGSGVRSFFGNGWTVSKNTGIICIGEVTAGVLEEYNVKNYRTASVSTADGILRTVMEEQNVKVQKIKEQ